MMKRILVVDDSLTTLKQIGAQLANSYDVLLAGSGALALQIGAQEKPDLVLLDVEMPVMDGFETIAELKRNPFLGHVPVIFLTGHNDTATEIRALESGAMDFITKPLNRDILLHRIELHLRYSTYQNHLESIIRDLEDSIVVSFAELIGYKDEMTGGHMLRTSKYVELLGRRLLEMGWFGSDFSESDLNMMVRAAPFHDIGKIGISDVFLLKPGPLSAEEYEEVKKHTTIGARVLKAIHDRTPAQTYLEYAQLFAEGHHERYDGTGYPHGLGGEEIPLCCRLMSVVNVYDACVTPRIYRPALTHEEARRAVLAGRGTEFDPFIVDVFDSIYEKFAKLTVVKMQPLLQKLERNFVS
ncbi:MAG: response regulator [Synergistaceae bacterium]|jgi:putative two-component system response regulator|nr:response regulator [Synergistaceae bacterium]